MPNQVAQRITDSVLMTAVSRISMALSIPVVIFVYSLFMRNMDYRLVNLENTIKINLTTEMSVRLAEVLQAYQGLDKRVSVVENRQINEAATQAKSQAEINSKMDKLADSISTLADAVSKQTITTAVILDRLQYNGLTPPKELLPNGK
jgi:hypothetical protein